MPARTSIPNFRTPAAMASALRIARARSIEGSDEPVACGVDLSTTETAEFVANCLIVPTVRILPSTVAKVCGLARRADNIGEQDRGKGYVLPHQNAGRQ